MEEKKGFFGKLVSGLTKTRNSIVSNTNIRNFKSKMFVSNILFIIQLNVVFCFFYSNYIMFDIATL